jgi:hypothetical protein
LSRILCTDIKAEILVDLTAMTIASQVEVKLDSRSKSNSTSPIKQTSYDQTRLRQGSSGRIIMFIRADFLSSRGARQLEMVYKPPSRPSFTADSLVHRHSFLLSAPSRFCAI